MKRGQQLLSFYLALCVAFAGAVGLSPALHVFVEHGGEGRAHTHVGADGVAHSHVEGARSKPGVFRIAAPAETAARSVIIPSGAWKPVTLLGLQPQDLGRSLERLFAKVAAHLPSAPAKNDAGHTHHSLPQMLVGGVVEGTVVAPCLVFAPETFAFVSLLSDPRPAPAPWYAPTASRGPPCCC